MFGKRLNQPPAAPAAKPAAPAQAATPGWLVQALTTEYVVEGQLPPVDTPLLGYLNMSNQATLTLTPARLTPLEPQALIAEVQPPEVSIVKATLIAFVPLDERAVASIRGQMPPRTLAAVLYAGPYVLRAGLAMMGDMPLRHLFNTGAGNFIVATDVEVRCQVLGTSFAPLVAPLALLNKTLIQLYHPAG